MNNKTSSQKFPMEPAVLITCLVAEMRKDDKSWCGETHLQKAAYFLQELTYVPFDFDFILYKHGPFSFKLRDQLTALRADGLLKLELADPYGPRFKCTNRVEEYQEEHKLLIQKYRSHIKFVAEKLEGMYVNELEPLATALFVTRLPDAPTEAKQRAVKVTNRKPHIPDQQALKAVMEVDELIRQAMQFSGQDAPDRV